MVKFERQWRDLPRETHAVLIKHPFYNTGRRIEAYGTIKPGSLNVGDKNSHFLLQCVKEDEKDADVEMLYNTGIMIVIPEPRLEESKLEKLAKWEKDNTLLSVCGVWQNIAGDEILAKIGEKSAAGAFALIGATGMGEARRAQMNPHDYGLVAENIY